MKVALVSQDYPPETARGGIGSQAYTKAHGLAALGHEVYVISRSIDSKRHDHASGNVQVIRIGGMEQQLEEMTEPVQWLTHSMVVAAEIEALNKRVQLDLIEFPEWGAEGYIYLLNRTDWNKIPVVIHLHGPMVMLAQTIGWPEKESAFYKTGIGMEAACVQMADGVYSSSFCSAEWVRKYYDPGRKNIPVIHLGIDTGVFTPQPEVKNKRRTILFAGRIVKNKGVEELINATINLANEFPDLQLLVIGRGEENYVKQIKTKLTKSGKHNLVYFSSFIEKKDLPAEFSKAHIFAAPSYYEGGPGFVYLEAMACGLPVIGCSGSGVEEIITPGVNGMLVPPKDQLALEDAIRQMLLNKDFMDLMGSNARKYAIENADHRKCLKKLEEYYHSVVNRHTSEKKKSVELIIK